MNRDELQDLNEKRQEFRLILLELSADQEILKEPKKRSGFYLRLEKLYYAPDNEKRFRHFYSDIFSVLTQINDGDDQGSIDVLGQNMDILLCGYQAKNSDDEGKLIDISDQIRKLYDHISLDIARIKYSEKGDVEVSGQESIEKIRSQINDDESKIITLQDSVKEATVKADKMQKEYVSILAIFAAVIGVFFSGVGFSTSVLSNIDKSSIYRILLGVSILGMFLFNLLALLLGFIREIVVNKTWSLRVYIIGNLAFIIILTFIYVAWIFQVFGEASF
ncbi:hypothetical protein [Dialister succinatiphilus]|uniref:hypothetical protein n=1 Tax=Dialister succinatiphilus TaxID=487173 RepID=UPI0040286ADD